MGAEINVQFKDLHVKHPASDHTQVLKDIQVTQLLRPCINVQITWTQIGIQTLMNTNEKNRFDPFSLAWTKCFIPAISSKFLKVWSCSTVRPDALVTGSLDNQNNIKSHCGIWNALNVGLHRKSWNYTFSLPDPAIEQWLRSTDVNQIFFQSVFYSFKASLSVFCTIR